MKINIIFNFGVNVTSFTADKDVPMHKPVDTAPEPEYKPSKRISELSFGLFDIQIRKHYPKAFRNQQLKQKHIYNQKAPFKAFSSQTKKENEKIFNL